MEAATLISRFGKMNGQATSVADLKLLHKDIQAYLDSTGSGAKVGELRQIYDRLAKGIRAAGGEKRIQIIVDKQELSRKEKNSSAGIGLKDLMNLKGNRTRRKNKKSKRKKPEKYDKVPVSKKNTHPHVMPTGVMSAEQISKMSFKKISLSGKYIHDFGSLNCDTQIMIWGPPGGGKTVYVLQLAQEMAENMGLEVLFVANEELGRSSFTEKIREFSIGNKNLSFAKNIPGDLSRFEAIFFDSIQSLGMDLEAYKTFARENSGKILVLIIQSTKEGDFRGGKDWEHEVDIAGEVINRRLVIRKNRLDPNFYVKSRKLIKEQKVSEQKFKKEIRDQVMGKSQPKKKAA